MASRVLKLAVATCTILLSIQGFAQTSTSCDPTKADCPPDLALSETNVYDFTESASSVFPAFGPVTYGSNGAVFTISKSGDSPTITSKWYIMFGEVSVVLKAAPGTGIVSSLVLESDDLDEIDYEWLGSDAGEVQSNYFGKGVTGSYNRGGTHPNPTSQSAFNTYTVEWTAQQITWSINNQVVRILTPAQATASGNSYPQTPMRIKIGAWSAGDPSNAPGTIAWAGGNTNYAAGPYSMYVQNVSVSDYSRGTQYEYSDRSGTYQSIRAVNGSVNTSDNGNNASAVAYNSGVSVPVPFATGGAVMAANSTSWNTTIVTMTMYDPHCGCTRTHIHPAAYSTKAPPQPTATSPPPLTTAASSTAPATMTPTPPPPPPTYSNIAGSLVVNMARILTGSLGLVLLCN